MLRKLTDRIKNRLQDPWIDDHQTLNERKKSILLKVFFITLGALVIFFIIVSVFRKNYFNIVVDSSVFIVLSVFYFIFHARKYLRLNTFFFVIVFCLVSLFYVISGGVDNTGILFIVLLPIPVIMLIGRRPGLIVLSIFFVISLCSNFLFKNSSWCANYTFDYSIRVYVCFLVIVFLGYLNESVFDILYTRIQKTADSLKESREDYKTLSLNREKFLSIISHDLKNQIAGFYSAIEILKINYSELKDEERIEIINMLSENSEKNVRLLQDLLKWSMMKNNSFLYNPVSVKIEKIYKEIVELFDLEIEKKNISIFLKMKSNSEVYADYDMLSAVLRNLVSNAIKFSKKNGEISIKSEEHGDLMKVEVRDNGAGIDQQTLENLRQSIASSNIVSDNKYGSGIGLLLVKEFVETNNGELTIESQLNKGTRISFTVPLAE